jgi:prepilin-type N-terminal cleavage/methylation domain-containing protein
MRKQQGLTLVELLVAMAIMLVVMLAVLGAYSQGSSLKAHIQSSAKIQNKVRQAMDRVERDLRMIGYGVPDGQQIGLTTVWTPVVFYAGATAIGYRAEIDGGRAEIVCTPNSSNSDCPLTKLRLDSIDYYQDFNCDRPDGASGDMRLLAVFEGSDWAPVSCSNYSTTDNSITVSSVANNTFLGGSSEAVTVEQVYFQYTAKLSPPYGSLTRHVRYDYAPSNTFPPTGLASSVVAQNLTDLWFEYYDGSGTQLTGFPLNANRDVHGRLRPRRSRRPSSVDSDAVRNPGP